MAAKPNGFARFWEAYPNKVAKPAAEKAFARALASIGGDDPLHVLLDGLDRAKLSRSWADGYIPHPTTWLNQGRWDDAPSEITPIPRQAEIRTYAQPTVQSAKRAAREANHDRALAGLAAVARGRAVG